MVLYVIANVAIFFRDLSYLVTTRRDLGSSFARISHDIKKEKQIIWGTKIKQLCHTDQSDRNQCMWYVELKAGMSYSLREGKSAHIWQLHKQMKPSKIFSVTGVHQLLTFSIKCNIEISWTITNYSDIFLIIFNHLVTISLKMEMMMLPWSISWLKSAGEEWTRQE